QQMWAEPCFEDEGLSIARVHVRTDFIANVPATPQSLARLGLLMRHAGLSGLFYDPERPGRYQLAASIYVHEHTRPWLSRVVALVAVCQAAEAHATAEDLASMLRGRAAHSAHPVAGPRADLDPVTWSLERTVAPDGHGQSRYQGDEFLAALKMLEGSPFEFSGDGERLCCEFPFCRETSLLVADSQEVNPRIGGGLLIRLTLPAGATAPGDPAGTRAALELNRRELTGRSRAHFLGSWCPTEEGLCFVSFFPNILATLG